MVDKIGEVRKKEVKAHGNGAYVYLPKAWLGYEVKIEVTKQINKGKKKSR